MKLCSLYFIMKQLQMTNIFVFLFLSINIRFLKNYIKPFETLDLLTTCDFYTKNLYEKGRSTSLPKKIFCNSNHLESIYYGLNCSCLNFQSWPQKMIFFIPCRTVYGCGCFYSSSAQVLPCSTG